MTTRDELDRMAGIVLADKYRLTSLLGVGGMGHVYQAEQLGLGRSVAVKLLRPERARNTIERFRSEAMAASRINHPHAVAVYDFGVTGDEVAYLVMEHLRGRTLSERLEEGPLAAEEIVTIGAQVLSALAEAHHCGVVHCDLTADNVIIERMQSGDEFAKVIDFGLSRALDAGGRETPVGTPEYMAPEQIRGEPLGPATDIYAAGVLLYEMIVGRTPFAGAAVPVVLNGHLHAAPTAPREIIPACPRGLSDLIVRALAKEPLDRPASAREVRAALLSVLGQSRSAPASDPLPLRGGTATPSTLAAGTGEMSPHSERARPRRRTRLSCDLGAGQTPFFGRTAELDEIVAFSRTSDHDAVLRVLGEVGVGKARLLLEASHRLAHKAAVFVAAADPSGLRTPWFPILSMLEMVLGLGPDVNVDSLSQAVARCGLPERDVPGLAEIFDLPGPARRLELAVRRREAHSAALRALMSVQRRFPRAVLGFADADEYDQPSRTLLTALAREAVRHDNVRVIYTTSSADDELPAHRTLELGGLSPEHSRELTIHLAGDQVASLPARAIREVTEGSPSAIEQLAGWLELGNALASAPAMLVDLVSVRFNRLPASARRVLQAVSVHGSVAPRWLVEATSGDEQLDLFESGLTGLLVVEGDDLTIPSELVAHVIEACTPADVRRAMHRRAVDALEGIAPDGVIGHHAERAGDLERARACFSAAAEDAVRRFDDPGAAAWYGRAVEVARRLRERSDEDTETFAEIAIAAADLLRRTDARSLARGLLDEVESLRLAGLVQARLERTRAAIASAAGDPGRATEHLHAAIGAGIRAGDRSFLRDTYVELAKQLDAANRPDEAIDELSQGIDLVTHGGGLRSVNAPEDTWYMGLHLAERLLRAGRYDAARAAALDALNAAELQRSARGRGRMAALLSQIFEIAGNTHKALTYRAMAIDEMRDLGDRRSTAELLIESARTTRDERRTGRQSEEIEWAVPPERGLRLARVLASEIGWDEGVRRARGRRRR